MLSRRSLLTGLIAAPAVIRVAPLMRIAPLPLYGDSPLKFAFPDGKFLTLQQWRKIMEVEVDRLTRPPVLVMNETQYEALAPLVPGGVFILKQEMIPVGR